VYLDLVELDMIQRRTADLMGNIGGSCVRLASRDHFFATVMFLAGAFQSTDHGICNSVVQKYKFPVFGITPYRAHTNIWDRDCLVISDNYRRINNVGTQYYHSIHHRQDLVLPVLGIPGHASALGHLNLALGAIVKELCEYIDVEPFHIYPSVAH
jgi:hypothetical protein